MAPARAAPRGEAVGGGGVPHVDHGNVAERRRLALEHRANVPQAGAVGVARARRAHHERRVDDGQAHVALVREPPRLAFGGHLGVAPRVGLRAVGRRPHVPIVLVEALALRLVVGLAHDGVGARREHDARRRVAAGGRRALDRVEDVAHEPHALRRAEALRARERVVYDVNAVHTAVQRAQRVQPQPAVRVRHRAQRRHPRVVRGAELAQRAGLVVDELDLLRTAQRAVHRLALLDDQLVDELRREVGGGADDAGRQGRRHAADGSSSIQPYGTVPPRVKYHGSRRYGDETRSTSNNTRRE